MGRITADPGAVELYAAHLVATAEGRRLDGLRIVVDCAHGAASDIAPRVLAELGATVTALHDAPDGANINEKCGSTDPTQLSLAVVAHQADLGLAFDGDADRVIAVDHTGTIVDGDVLLALFALDLRERGHLARNTVAVTVMTNLGFRLAMEDRGITVRETDVGDRHVLAALDAEGLSLGGEQSGHIIFRSLSTTGDGILTGIALADLVQRSGRSLADLSDGLVERVPQRLVNVPIPQPERLADCAEVWEAVVKAEAELGHRGPGAAARRAAPSRWCVSWSRRASRPRPMRWPPSSPAWWKPPSGRSSRRHPGSLGPYVRHHRRHRRGRRRPTPPRRPAPARVPRLRLGRDRHGGRGIGDGPAAPSGGPGRPAAPTRWPPWPS